MAQYDHYTSNLLSAPICLTQVILFITHLANHKCFNLRARGCNNGRGYVMHEPKYTEDAIELLDIVLVTSHASHFNTCLV